MDEPATLLSKRPLSIALAHEMDTLVLRLPDRLPNRNIGNVAMIVLVLLGVGMAGVVSMLLLPVALVVAGVWMSMQRNKERDVLRLSPHTLQFDDREPFLLEDITRVEVCPPADSRWLRLHTRDGTFDLIGGLMDDEAEWLGQLVALRIQHRWAQLTEEGHDLSQRGAPPQEILLLR